MYLYFSLSRILLLNFRLEQLEMCHFVFQRARPPACFIKCETCVQVLKFSRQDTIIQIRGDPELSHHLSHHVVAQYQTKPEAEEAAILSGMSPTVSCRPNFTVEVRQPDSLGMDIYTYILY